MPESVINASLTRRSLSLSALAVVAGGVLAACGKDDPAASSSASPSASATPKPSTSASSSASASPSATVAAKTVTIDAIKVNGGFGTKPVVTGPWPCKIAKTASKVTVPGKGLTVEGNAQVVVNYLGLNTRDGKSFQNSFDTKQPAPLGLDQVVPGFKKGLEGKKVGDRVLIFMTAADGYANGQPDIGIQKGDNLIFVVDVLSTSVSKPTGTQVPPKAGLPTVKDNGEGKVPTVTIGNATKPTSSTIQPLIKGAGTAVKATDTISVRYECVGWSNGKLLVENFTTGAESAAVSALIPAWKKLLVGQTVGSRVLLIATPADSYPKGNDNPKIPAGETLVYVLDILNAGPGGA